MKWELKSQRGASIVEFAIVLPLLLLFVFGIIEFGLILYNKAMITNASREGARAAVVYRSPPLSQTVLTGYITSVVNSYCANHLVSFGGTKTITLTPPPTWGSGVTPGSTDLTVTVNYDYYFLVLKQFGVGGAKLTLTSTTVMVME